MRGEFQGSDAEGIKFNIEHDFNCRHLKFQFKNVNHVFLCNC